MHFTPDVEEWLQDAGYEFHCFISWAHTGSKEMTDCAIRVRDTIQSELSALIQNPRVFLDARDFSAGDDWREGLMISLCKSLTMVAICAPIYYQDAHKWCGQEWAAMDMLSQKRLAGEDFKPIIPLIVRISDPLPGVVAEVQYIDFSCVTTRSRRYYVTQEFKSKIQEIGKRIEQIALIIVRNQVEADCEQFQFPTESAFLSYLAKSQPFPLRSS